MEIIQTQQLIVIAAIFWMGYIGSKVFEKVNLPAVSGFLIVGVIIGPEVLNFLTDDIIHRLSFFDPLALSIITFIIGQGLNLKRIKDIWLNIISISFFEITVTVFLTYLTVFLITNSEVLALLMAIISISTAPATLVAVTEQMRAKGKLTDIFIPKRQSSLNDSFNSSLLSGI